MARCKARAVLLTFAIAAVAIAVCPATQAAPRGVARPMIVVGGATWCPYCMDLKKRLSTEAALQPLVRQYSVTFVDIDDKNRALLFAKKFGLAQVSIPTMVVATSDGKVLYVANG